ncbi:hypothetical protein SUGI_0887110 [Cryptomeria japonica]|uniref:uncharacterized protein LOC131067757 n=1 Tax=Cryptomeria japonica TaxID=3369 RepID=UPI0024149E4D|nr:uncharacterized protein LOC131067757 [Cryptomeria japonica]GLJ42780.1 hypothetical protein SUGI_0887110 [Cryptomeria japonica]
MGTAVMQAQDCLSPYEGLMGAVYRAPAKPKSKSPSRKKSGHAQQEKKRPEAVTDSRKRSVKSQNFQRQNGKGNLKEQGKNNMVMGQVTILKRGHTVESTTHAMGRLGVSPPKAEFVARPTRSAGFEPATFVKTFKAKPKPEEWAGPAFANSPSPSCVPLPNFSVKKTAAAAEEKVLIEDEFPQIDSSATRDLRRLLGLV